MKLALMGRRGKWERLIILTKATFMYDGRLQKSLDWIAQEKGRYWVHECFQMTADGTGLKISFPIKTHFDPGRW